MPIQDAINKAKKAVKDTGEQILLGTVHGAGELYKSTAKAVERATDPRLQTPPEENTKPIEIGRNYSDIPKNVWKVLTATPEQVRKTQKDAQKQIRKELAPVTNPINASAKKEVARTEKTLSELKPQLKATGKTVSFAAENLPDALLSGGRSTLKKAVNVAQGMARAYGNDNLKIAVPLQIATKGNSHLGNYIQSAVQNITDPQQ